MTLTIKQQNQMANIMAELRRELTANRNTVSPTAIDEAMDRANNKLAYTLIPVTGHANYLRNSRTPFGGSTSV